MTPVRKRSIVDADSGIRPAPASHDINPPDEPTLDADEQDVIPQSTGPLTAVEAVAGAAAGAIAGPPGIAGVGTAERSYPAGGPREAPDTGVGGDTR